MQSIGNNNCHAVTCTERLSLRGSQRFCVQGQFSCENKSFMIAVYNIIQLFKRSVHYMNSYCHSYLLEASYC